MKHRVVRRRWVKFSGWLLTLGGASGLLALQGQPAAAGAEPSQATATRQQPKGMPLRFEANRGQLAADVDFLARGQGYGLYLGSTAATLRLLRSAEPGVAELEPASLTVRLEGARAVEPVGIDELPGKSHYFTGGDAAKFRTDIESYRAVRYPQVLSGVSIVYYGTDGHEIEYDLELDPGASPASLELDFEGAEALSLDAEGAAVFELKGGGKVRQSPPLSYQLDARGRRTIVPSHYELRGALSLGFSVGSYDRSRPLIIDPTIAYAAFVGGNFAEDTYGLARDPAGNIYVVGQTTSTIFSLSTTPYQTHLSGFSDAFISKINSTVSGFVYSTYLGGSGSEFAYGVVADAAGNAYVAGLTSSNNFPVAAAYQGVSGGGFQDGFVTKLSPTGSALLFSTYLGGSGDDYVGGLALDASNNVALIGTTSSPNFPVLGAVQGTLGGVNDAFVTKLNATGASLVYSTYLGGSATEAGAAIRLASTGDAVVTGATSSSNFPIFAAYQGTRSGNFDAFVTRLSSAGSSLVYSTYLGGTNSDRGAALALDPSDNVYLVGDTNSANFPVAAALQPALAGGTDAFLSQLTATGSSLVYSTYLGGSAADIGLGVGLHGTSPYVVGSTASSNFPLQSATQFVYGGGSSDGFVTKLRSGGGSLLFSTFVGGNNPDRAVAILVDAEANGIVAGNTQSTDFPAVSPFRPFGGGQDAFVVRYNFSHAAPGSGPLTTGLLALLLAGLGLLLAPRFRRGFSAPS